jgi:hypothetical protein
MWQMLAIIDEILGSLTLTDSDVRFAAQWLDENREL